MVGFYSKIHHEGEGPNKHLFMKINYEETIKTSTKILPLHNQLEAHTRLSQNIGFVKKLRTF